MALSNFGVVSVERESFDAVLEVHEGDGDFFEPSLQHQETLSKVPVSFRIAFRQHDLGCE